MKFTEMRDTEVDFTITKLSNSFPLQQLYDKCFKLNVIKFI